LKHYLSAVKKIAILASGSGTNADNITRYFQNHPLARVVWLGCDRRDAFVFKRMESLGVPTEYINRNDLSDGGLLKKLLAVNADLVVLAGFLKLVPKEVIETYRGRIINIHPALLPKFGGKGMYGSYVHEAVVQAGEKKTGITIHHVNEQFDEGEIITQYDTDVSPGDTPGDVAKKIHELEMKWYPKVIETLLS
jgi:phosphoribosylglycinamide formyltransferase 1